MTKNIGNIERVIRAVVGIAVVAWGVSSNNWLGTLGLVPLVTAAIGWCPPYALLGFNTCSVKAKDSK